MKQDFEVNENYLAIEITPEQEKVLEARYNDEALVVDTLCRTNFLEDCVNAPARLEVGNRYVVHIAEIDWIDWLNILPDLQD